MTNTLSVIIFMTFFCLFVTKVHLTRTFCDSDPFLHGVATTTKAMQKKLICEVLKIYTTY
jgi:hypothetical protein